MTDSSVTSFWRKCSSCKKPILFRALHYVCSVSTCNSPRTGYVFCSVLCFERHVPGARHKDAAAIEARAPATNTPLAVPKTTSNEVLVIASRLKEYIQRRADYNTAGDVMDVLSEHLRILCERAIDRARAEGRKTVMGRDFDFLKNMK